MLVKVFESEDMASALKKVKESLGPDALILSTRTVRKGGLGVLGKPTLEVTAAVESPDHPGGEGKSTKSAPGRRGVSPVEASALRGRFTGGDELSYDDLWTERPEPRPHQDVAPRRSRNVAERAAEPTADLSSLRGEIDELKNLVKGFIADSQNQRPFASAAAAMDTVVEAPRSRPAPAAVKAGEEQRPPMVDRLRERGIDQDAASTIVETSRSKIGSYSRELYDAYVERHGTTDPSVGLASDRFRLD